MINKGAKIFIITGGSGSGKSTAIAVFEDSGFYCVDNMPVALLPGFLDLAVGRAHEIAGYAFVMDLREHEFLAKYPSVFEKLRKQGYQIEIIFLEADEDVLLERYSQARRVHPLAKDRSLLEGIRAEKQQLLPLRRAAGRVIDTTQRTVHELKKIILTILQKSTQLAPLRVQVMSFGFKYGVPHEADLIVDVRFLPNPYFIPELKPLDGRHADIKDFVHEAAETKTFLNKYLDLLDYLMPLYEKEGKAYLTVAVGCTGGRHRSVVISETMFKHAKDLGLDIELLHRDINQDS